MADSEKLIVLKALTTHLKGISPANGYTYNVSNAVFRGRTLFGENDPLPMLSILESPSARPGVYAGENSEVVSNEWQLMIQGWCDDTEDIPNNVHPTDEAYNFMDAVENRLSRIVASNANSGFPTYPGEHMLGGLIASLEWGPGTVRPPMDQVSSKAFFFLSVRIGLAGKVG